MAYDIVFVDQEESSANGAPSEKRGGGSVFLSHLPTDPKVFAFFYAGSGAASNEVAIQLRALGQKTGKNLYVNIGSLRDPDYAVACERFGVKALPAVVMTAISPLAATPEGETTFARLDRKTLFARPETLVRTVEELFNLFIAGRIKEAIDVARARQRETAVVSMAKRAWAVIEPVITWIGERDIKLGFLGAKIEVRRSRGR